MTTKQVLEAMSKGAVLCMQFNNGGRQYWLEPKRMIVSNSVAEGILSLPNLKNGNDGLGLFRNDDLCQTWRL